MERGTEWEQQAVRERWTAMERKRATVTRLLSGLMAIGGAIVLLLLAAATEVCFTTVRGGIVGCTPVTQSVVAILMGLLGVVTLSAGVWACWTVL